MLYNRAYAANKAELTISQNDLDVFQFILTFIQCKILLESHDVAGKYKKMLTPRAKRSIDQILRAVEQKKSFIQPPLNANNVNATSPPPMVVEVKDVIGEDNKPCIGATGQVKMGADTPTEQDAAGQGMGDEDEC